MRVEIKDINIRGVYGNSDECRAWITGNATDLGSPFQSVMFTMGGRFSWGNVRRSGVYIEAWELPVVARGELSVKTEWLEELRSVAAAVLLDAMTPPTPGPAR